MKNFNERRRQKYIDEESYAHTISHYSEGEKFCNDFLSKPEQHTGEHATAIRYYASDLWRTFQLKYTAGEDLSELAQSLTAIVDVYDRYVQKNEEVPDDDYLPPFLFVDMLDTYVNFLHLLCASILLHREDLLPTIFSWIKGGEYDGEDAVLEELLNFYFPDRPSPDHWIWKPYQKLLDVLDANSADERPKLMKKYVKGWYSGMKGKAAFWGQHEKITPDFSPYSGYWAMCAGAFTYLLDLDDSSYRDEEVYPKDMVDYARSQPRRAVKLQDGSEILRVEGGQRCPSEGTWFSPAKSDSSRYFKVGETMPVFDASEYGHTIWQRVP
jgi:hypothetical protein